MGDKITKVVIIGTMVFLIIITIIILPIYILLSPITVLGNIFGREEKQIVNTMKQEYPLHLSYGQLIFYGTYPMPIGGIITSEYGNRIHPITGKRSFHSGIDISGAGHSNIISIANGKVISVDVDKIYGNNITIHHILYEETEDEEIIEINFYTFYAHLSRVDVIEGQEVKQGNVIGLEGGNPDADPNPGLSTGHHLHFEVWNKKRESVNPISYLFYNR